MLFINILKYISLFLIISIIGLYSFVEYRIFQFNKNSIDIIAHAGGQIDGHIYTNSLEALNNSYNEGAKIFELDIRETKDGYYVGTHDWKTWAQQTGYSGELPPNLEEFKRYKILNKYTAMSFEDINNWFLSHPDVVFITDKVDKPLKMVNLFYDKSKIKMELFSKKSMRMGGGIFDGAMANYYSLMSDNKNSTCKIWFYFNDRVFKKNNLKYVVAGKPFSYEDKFKLKLIRLNGIKIYMYLFGTNDEITQQVIEYRSYLDGVYYNKIPN